MMHARRGYQTKISYRLVIIRHARDGRPFQAAPAATLCCSTQPEQQRWGASLSETPPRWSSSVAGGFAQDRVAYTETSGAGILQAPLPESRHASTDSAVAGLRVATLFSQLTVILSAFVSGCRKNWEGNLQ